MPPTLLLADDSLTIQRVIQLTFADEDVQVVAVSDGDQAIARIEAEPPNIVLADVDMPGKNGYEVARHIKQSPRLAHIPVLLLTGALEPTRSPAESGCDGVLSKPFEPQLVITTVRDLLNRAAAASPAAETTRSTEIDPPAAGEPQPLAPQTIDEAAAARDSVPTLADAFAALLDAERRGAAAPDALLPPIPEPPATVSDDVIEDVVRRVLARLPDAVIREAVKETVAGAAERLVREEIDRIKAAIK